MGPSQELERRLDSHVIPTQNIQPVASSADHQFSSMQNQIGDLTKNVEAIAEVEHST